jgi:hypothetical protein
MGHKLVTFAKEFLARLVLIRHAIHRGIAGIRIAFDIGHTRIGNPSAFRLPFDIVFLVALIMDLTTVAESGENMPVVVLVSSRVRAH